MIQRLLLLILCAGFSLPAAVTIKLATLAPRGTSPHQVLLEMRQQWQQTGAVDLRIYPDGTMGGDSAMVSRMQVNQLQAAVLTVVGLSEIDNSVTALQYMPMMFDSLDEVDYVQEQLRPEIERRLAAKGYVVLFWGDLGWVRMFSKTPVSRPDELKKLKMFTWSGDVKQVDLMKAIGLQPVPLETADIPSSLQSGLISAVPMPPMFALASQITTSAPYMLELNYAPLLGAAVVTQSAWSSIPEASRAALLISAQQTGGKMRTRNRAESDEAVEAMKKRGLKVRTVPPELAAEWHQLAEQAYPKIRGNLVPAHFFDQVVELLKKYRARRQ
jgi:TRAP-type C4-dicarboxylate transport system substrate-binding protein